jgi:4-diphosphocytidyl-2-C-methyl-D-erythritol kinase
MIVFPTSKINLGLRILRKREDGFHDLDTLFYPVPITDVLEILQDRHALTGVAFTGTGIFTGNDPAQNLCVRAWQLLKADFPQLPAIQLHLHKAIPVGAGLGGGSADGAFTLRLLNQLFNLDIGDEQLLQYALQLGSDCPFFIYNQPCLATGRGEQLTPFSIDLSAYKLLLINPGIHVSTGWAFSQLTPRVPEQSLRSIVEQPVDTWKDRLINDFEAPVFAHYPAIAAIKASLYAAGAVYAAMSGSGSTVLGLFEKNKPMPVLSWPDTYWSKSVAL